MATIIKRIEKEDREIDQRSPIWREAVPMNVHMFAVKEGEMPDEFHQLRIGFSKQGCLEWRDVATTGQLRILKGCLGIGVSSSMVLV